MKTSNRITLSLFCIIACSPSIAEDVAVPHTFFSGDPASAQQVNENFDALTHGLNSLARKTQEINQALDNPAVDPVIFGPNHPVGQLILEDGTLIPIVRASLTANVPASLGLTTSGFNAGKPILAPIEVVVEDAFALNGLLEAAVNLTPINVSITLNPINTTNVGSFELTEASVIEVRRVAVGPHQRVRIRFSTSLLDFTWNGSTSTFDVGNNQYSGSCDFSPSYNLTDRASEEGEALVGTVTWGLTRQDGAKVSNKTFFDDTVISLSQLTNDAAGYLCRLGTRRHYEKAVVLTQSSSVDGQIGNRLVMETALLTALHIDVSGANVNQSISFIYGKITNGSFIPDDRERRPRPVTSFDFDRRTNE
nr:hypothetical protein [Oceanococcus sp. HetDA_MAG_MS8]